MGYQGLHIRLVALCGGLVVRWPGKAVLFAPTGLLTPLRGTPRLLHGALALFFAALLIPAFDEGIELLFDPFSVCGVIVPGGASGATDVPRQCSSYRLFYIHLHRPL